MESTATLTDDRAINADPSLVHTLETTAICQLPSDYQDWKALQHQPEYGEALNLYCRVDNREGTTKAEDFLNCHRFAWFTRHEDTGMIKIASNSCRLKWCPMCSANKRYIIRQAVKDWLKTIRNPKFMTFTVKHSDLPLAEQIKKIYKAYRLFRLHKFLKNKQRGGVWFFQIKRSKKTGQWHPHIHVVMDMDYINKVQIQDDWLLTTGDSFVVDIRAIKDPGKVADYVARYASTPCKLTEFNETDQDTIFSVLRGKRLCGKFGTGNSCLFKPQKPIDFAKWSRLCRWTDCILNRSDNSLLEKLIKAWATNKPLGKETADSISESYAPHDWLKLHPEKAAEQEKQFFLDYS